MSKGDGTLKESKTVGKPSTTRPKKKGSPLFDIVFYLLFLAYVLRQISSYDYSIWARSKYRLGEIIVKPGWEKEEPKVRMLR